MGYPTAIYNAHPIISEMAHLFYRNRSAHLAQTAKLFSDTADMQTPVLLKQIIVQRTEIRIIVMCRHPYSIHRGGCARMNDNKRVIEPSCVAKLDDVPFFDLLYLANRSEWTNALVARHKIIEIFHPRP